jgi:uncharacterized paraquat-inducible protein A
MIQMVICNNCGALVSKKEKACLNCGSTTYREERFPFFSVLVVFIILVLFGTIIIWSMQSQNGTYSKKTINSMNKLGEKNRTGKQPRHRHP